MGLVLNRPVEATVDEAAPELADVVDGAEPLFQGGPVQPSGVIVLAEFADPDDAAMLVVDGVGPLAAAADLTAIQVVDGRARAFAGDVVGSSVARVKGTGDGPLLAVVGHIDEIGLVVRHIDDNGFLWFTNIGGWDPQILVGQRVEIATRKGSIPGVVGKKPNHLLKD